jgi:saccharopine dehydrogenase-like NADP-dependent oxidoreductase
MKSILLLGAGRSAPVLIAYLQNQARHQGWHLSIADVDVSHLQHLALPDTLRLLPLDIAQADQVQVEILAADLVISLLPAALHPQVARLCLQHRKHLLTASYVSPEIRALHQEARQAGLVFMMEAGLDPGLDHMSALAALARVHQAGGKITSFKSYTGGLVAPASDTNPWHYKFSWNPRNVVLAGQGTARYLDQGQVKFIPYHQLFRRLEALQVLDLGEFEGYANRDSLPYLEAYGLSGVSTLLRGTLRRPGYCAAWQQLVLLGLTADDYQLPQSESLSYRQFLEAFMPPAAAGQPWQQRLAAYLGLAPESQEMQLLSWLDFPEEAIGLPQATPAQVLEKLLTRKWQLAPGDKDLVGMQHLLEYEKAGKLYRLKSSLSVIGEDERNTAMAKTVGLPAGILAVMILQNRIKQRGVLIPTAPEIYGPVLAELEGLGIRFEEEEKEIT